MANYSLRFGQTPVNIIERTITMNNIVGNLLIDYPISNAFIITGVRGCGKTVLLTNVSRKIHELNNWIVVDVNPEKEILSQIAASINESTLFKKLFVKVSFNFSFKGFGVSIQGLEPASDIKIVVEKMLEYLKKNNIKVLITIDEVSNTNIVRAFIHDFQSLIRQEFLLYLLMTGLNENVESLQNNKALTFLIRTPKYHLEPLNIDNICDNYMRNLNIDDITARELSELTKGYAFAFQVVGLLFDKYKNLEKIYDELDIYLSSYVYDKIWSSVPDGEKTILRCFTNNFEMTTSDILKTTNMNSKMFSVYRDRLIKRGILISNKIGYLSLTLPRFNVYVSKQLD